MHLNALVAANVDAIEGTALVHTAPITIQRLVRTSPVADGDSPS
jgi:hypothetical protein